MADLRRDPITGRWVIISTERGNRPTELPSVPREPSSPNCPLCPGNEARTPPEIWADRDGSSAPNTSGWRVRIVANKFPALRVEGNLDREGFGMYDRMNGIGAHEVIIETPDHDKTLRELDVEHVESVLRGYHIRMMDLKRDRRLRYILIFKNEGSEAGASLPHPHSQLIALPITPKRVKEELTGALEYFKYRERCIFCDMIREELRDGGRVILETPDVVVFCPFASRFPFELCLIPKVHEADFARLPIGALGGIAAALKTALEKLAAILDNPQYNFVLHTAPARIVGLDPMSPLDEDYHWHLEIMPRLTKVAGFEWGSGVYINPTPPEAAARALRDGLDTLP